jgi:hypothetical protein
VKLLIEKIPELLVTCPALPLVLLPAGMQEDRSAVTTVTWPALPPETRAGCPQCMGCLPLLPLPSLLSSFQARPPLPWAPDCPAPNPSLVPLLPAPVLCPGASVLRTLGTPSLLLPTPLLPHSRILLPSVDWGEFPGMPLRLGLGLWIL